MRTCACGESLMGEKVKVSISIDKEVYNKSHSLGINVSKACENYLKTLNQTIEQANDPNKVFGEAFSEEKGSWCGRRDLNPGRQRGRDEIKEIDWEKFRKFCENGNCESHAQQLYSNAERFHEALLKHDLSVVRDLGDGMRPGALKGLSALSKFLGCYDDFKDLKKQYGLKWSGKSADDIFIERLTNVEDSGEIWEWVRSVKQARSDLTDFMDLMSISGLRYIEGINSYNLIIKLSREGKIGSYYSVEKESLEHFRFKETFIRRSKKAFVSFAPGELITRIAGQELFTSADAVQKLVQKKGLPLRFSDIRENHGTFMTKYLKPSEIDFLHGRVTANVFMQHYFNPALIADLKARAFEGIREIQEKVKA